MPQSVHTVRATIQAQGFCSLDEATCARIDYPLRLAPAICMAWAAVGAALQSAILAFIPFGRRGCSYWRAR